MSGDGYTSYIQGCSDVDETLLLNIGRPGNLYIKPPRSLTALEQQSARERKQVPLATGCLDYFPDALVAVAQCSFVGNEQHNPGTPLHWDRAKSGDESDALMRHFMQRGKVDTDGIRHSAKVAWRALALLQKELEVAGKTEEQT